MIVGIIIFSIVASITVYLILAGHAIDKIKEGKEDGES